MKKLKEDKGLHEPVLLREVLEALRVRELARSKKPRFIDATLGLGGHTIEIVRAGGYVLGIEADSDSLKLARRRLEEVFRGSEACPTPESEDCHFRGLFTLVNGNFKDIGMLAINNGFAEVDGILFDLGISSYQLQKNAGFSFQDEKAPLDMRIDPINQEVRASDLLKVLDETQLSKLFTTTLSRAKAKLLAKVVVKERTERKIETVGDFLYTIRGLFRPRKVLNPATLPFLAMRIAVNSELENLRVALPLAFELLASGGRLVVISFHSGEDAIVKKYFRLKKDTPTAKLITKKPITPSLAEILRNPHARSAKMRILEKI